MNTQFCLCADKLWLRGISGTSCITYYAAFLKYLQMAYLCFCLDILNKTPLNKNPLHKRSVYNTQTYFDGHPQPSSPILFSWLQMPIWSLTGLQYIYIYIYMYIYKVLTCLPSVQGRQIYEWIGYYLPTIRWIFRTWSGLALGLCLLTEHLTAWCCLLPCRICRPWMLSRVPKYSSIRSFRNSFKDYYFDHQSQCLNHWLLSLILLSLLLSLYFQIPSVWEITFFRKLPSCFCTTFTNFLPSVIFMNPSADRIPSLCLRVLNKTPIIFQTNGLCTRHNR